MPSNTMDHQKDEFVRFLQNPSIGILLPGQWEQFVATHYMSEDIEDARIDLIRASLNEDSCVWTKVPADIQSSCAAGLS
jgi:hypothetical protein